MAMTSAEKVKAHRERKRTALLTEELSVIVPGAVNAVPADKLLKLVDELYMAGLFRGSEARIRLRALVKEG